MTGTCRQPTRAAPVSWRTARGFSLLELLVVMSIMALILGITAATISGSNESAKLKAESRKIIAHLRHTRVRSLSESRIYSVSTVDEGRGYEISPGEEIVTLPDPFVMSLAAASVGSGTPAKKILFYPDGSSNGGVIRLAASDANAIINVNWLTGEVAHAPR